VSTTPRELIAIIATEPGTLGARRSLTPEQVEEVRQLAVHGYAVARVQGLTLGMLQRSLPQGEELVRYEPTAGVGYVVLRSRTCAGLERHVAESLGGVIGHLAVRPCWPAEIAWMNSRGVLP